MPICVTRWDAVHYLPNYAPWNTFIASNTGSSEVHRQIVVTRMFLTFAFAHSLYWGSSSDHVQILCYKRDLSGTGCIHHQSEQWWKQICLYQITCRIQNNSKLHTLEHVTTIFFPHSCRICSLTWKILYVLKSLNSAVSSILPRKCTSWLWSLPSRCTPSIVDWQESGGYVYFTFDFKKML